MNAGNEGRRFLAALETEPDMLKAIQAIGSAALEDGSPELLNAYAELADGIALHIEHGGHPRDRVALYPPDMEL